MKVERPNSSRLRLALEGVRAHSLSRSFGCLVELIFFEAPHLVLDRVRLTFTASFSVSLSRVCLSSDHGGVSGGLAEVYNQPINH